MKLFHIAGVSVAALLLQVPAHAQMSAPPTPGNPDPMPSSSPVTPTPPVAPTDVNPPMPPSSAPDRTMSAPPPSMSPPAQPDPAAQSPGSGMSSSGTAMSTANLPRCGGKIQDSCVQREAGSRSTAPRHRTKTSVKQTSETTSQY